MPETETERIIREAYEKETGSMKDVFEAIKPLNEGKKRGDETRIKMEDIKNWFKNNREKLQAPKKQNTNSYVAPGPGHELQIDLFHYYYKQPYRQKVKPDQPDKGPRLKINRAEVRATTAVAPYGLMAIDVFTKKMHVVPLKLNQAKDWREALEEIFNVLGVPKMIYTDNDSSVKEKGLQNYLKRKNVTSVITRQHASFAERAIRYLKNRLSDKLELKRFKDGAPESYWTKHYQEAVDYYNNRHVQDTTNMKPVEAEKPENEFDVKTNLEINARHRRRNPELEVGDVVRSFRKKKVGEKERAGDYAPGQKRVTEITKSLGQTFYKLDDEEKPYVRADIALIKKRGERKYDYLDDFDQDKEEEEEHKQAKTVPKKVNDARNIKIDEDDREVDIPKGKTKTILESLVSISKMNKKAQEDFWYPKPEQSKKTKDPPRNQKGGSSGSGIPRDPKTGRAL